VYCYIVGELSNNNSQMDKVWSILPVIYAWIIVYHNPIFDLRLLVMAILISFWGIRLTYNFAKKGAYSLKFWSGEEDYRWQVLREHRFLNKKWKWMLFDLLFISMYQNILVLLITLPMLVSMESNVEFHWLDGIVSFILFGFIVFETIADKQQMDFQTKKYDQLKKGVALNALPKPYDKGFISYGLWGRSRHPNYFAEQSIWVVIYVFSVLATGSVFNWTLVGSMFLILLFMGSSSFSENISLSKYPEYQDYIHKVSKYVPFKKYQGS